MKRRTKEKEAGDREKFKTRTPRISHETKKSAIGILLICIAVILLLASFSKAGPAGAFVFSVLDRLFGWGYYLLPAVALFVGVLFLISREQKFFGITFFGAAIFMLSGLGLLDLVFPDRAGLVGRMAGTLETPFGKIAALILTAAFFIIGLLVTFNASIKMPIFRKKPQEPEEDLEVVEAPDYESRVKKKAETEASEGIKGKETSKELGKESERDEPIIVAKEPDWKMKAVKNYTTKSKDYVAPPLELLKSSIEKPTAGDLRANANIIKRTLESFGISVEMGEINIGPKVTRYTLKPAEGVKLTRILALNQDLALALAAHPIRIEAPIPGKSLVGIEVPNKAAAIVRLGSLMAYPDFAGSEPLTFIVGRDVTGEPIMTDIAKMPHLLIAGSTGSGKSVAIHSLIISMLYKNSPETLRLILIDPKRVELSVYEGIPHLISPVITENKKSVGVFRWTIQEMERRYELLLGAGARDILSYNKGSRRGESEPLPYLVLVIDELADLMASYGREVEGSIVRLAQMARATGIHLVVSTQRPSVEVITGLIKANITSRIALQVASQIDSRTILDSAGAEKLLGSGDLLFVSPEYSKPKRIQGAYISEEEINKVADFIRTNNSVANSILESAATSVAADSAVEGGGTAPGVFDAYMNEDDDDALYEEAVQVVKDAKKASASLLQRRLKVGYARAARLLDIMEAKGVVGPGDGAKPREVFEE